MVSENRFSGKTYFYTIASSSSSVLLVGRDRPEDDREDVEADGQGRQAVPTPKDEPEGEIHWTFGVLGSCQFWIESKWYTFLTHFKNPGGRLSDLFPFCAGFWAPFFGAFL